MTVAGFGLYRIRLIGTRNDLYENGALSGAVFSFKWYNAVMKNKTFRIVLGAALAIFLAISPSGTKSAEAQTGTTCQIGSFYGQPATVSYGGSTTLFWSLYGNCANASISNGIGYVSNSGSVSTGALIGSSYYTLTATDTATGGSATRQIFIGVTGGTTGYGTAGGYSSCVINSFAATPNTITSGQSATLSWTTSGCQNTTVTGGSIYGSYAPMSGSMSTGPLYGTTSFTLSANGASGSTSASTSVSVINSPYPYSYACQSGAYGSDPSCSSQYAGNFITTPATNVGATTARLNALGLNTPDTFSAYFEYGTNPSYLDHATSFQALGNVTTYQIQQKISTKPGTTYYYRVVAQISGNPAIIRGNTLSFTTPASDTVAYVSDSGDEGTPGSGSTTGTSGTSKANAIGVQVTVTNQGDKLAVGDTAEYTITYANGSSKTLKDSVLSIVLPQGFTVKQTTQGLMLTPTNITITLGTLAPNQTGSVYVQATVGPNTMLDTTLVTSATLNYTLPNGTHDSAVGYVLNHATSSGVFGGFAFGSGFFPSTLFGWFITIIIILVIILIARRISKEKHAAEHGGGHH